MSTVVSDGHIKLDVVEVTNNQSYVRLRLTLQSTGRVYQLMGTVRLAGNTSEQFYAEGESAPGTTFMTFTRDVPWDNDQTMDSTVRFTGQYYYKDEDDENITVSYWDTPLQGFYHSVRPVTTSISVNRTTVELGSSVNITTAYGQPGALTWKIGSRSGTIATVGNTTTPWTPPLDDGTKFARYITNSKTATCTLTWNGVSTNITLKVPSNSSTLPTVGISITPYNNTDLQGAYVLGKTQAAFTVTGTGKLGASIAAWNVTFNGQTFNGNNISQATGYTSNALTGPDANNKVWCSYSVTDSRGYTSSGTSSVTVVAYNSPALSGVQIFRADSSGNADNEGTYIRFVFTPAITSVSNKNAKKYRLQYKRSTQSSWTSVPSSDWGTLSDYTSQFAYTVNANASIQYLYDARVAIEDAYETVYSAVFALPTAAVIMDFNSAGTGGGVGMYTQGSDMFDIAWQLVLHKGIRPAGQTNEKGKIIPVKTIQIDSSTPWADVGAEWLKQVCTLWPGVQESIFIGTGVMGSRGFFIAFIYNTSSVDANTGLPEYAFGSQWWYGSSAATNYYHFGTSAFSYFSRAV